MRNWAICVHAFFINNTFISNARLKLTKNQARAKQHREAELIIICFLHSSYHPKIIGDILKNMQNKSASVLISLYD